MCLRPLALILGAFSRAGQYLRRVRACDSPPWKGNAVRGSATGGATARPVPFLHLGIGKVVLRKKAHRNGEKADGSSKKE